MKLGTTTQALLASWPPEYRAALLRALDQDELVARVQRLTEPKAPSSAALRLREAKRLEREARLLRGLR